MLTQRRGDDLYSIKKIWYISIISVAKPKNFIIIAFTYVRECCTVLGDFCMNSCSVDSDEEIKL
jgi:hypothetical protein